MKKWVLIALSLILVLCMAACDTGTQPPEQTTDAPTTQAPTTKEPTEAPTTEEITTEQPTTQETTTEEITTEEITTEEVTTQAPAIQHPSREEVKAAAAAFVEADDMIAASANENHDWSDFGGLTKNEDGSVTALIQEDTVAVWDPYFYVIKQDTTVDNIMVIQYRCAMEYGLDMYLGTKGNAATGAGDMMSETLYETGDDWGYLIVDIGMLAGAYDANSAILGYLRLDFNYIESGETVDIGYIAFFHTMEDAEAIIPQ